MARKISDLLYMQLDWPGRLLAIGPVIFRYIVSAVVGAIIAWLATLILILLCGVVIPAVGPGSSSYRVLWVTVPLGMLLWPLRSYKRANNPEKWDPSSVGRLAEGGAAEESSPAGLRPELLGEDRERSAWRRMPGAGLGTHAIFGGFLGWILGTIRLLSRAGNPEELWVETWVFFIPAGMVVWLALVSIVRSITTPAPPPEPDAPEDLLALARAKVQVNGTARNLSHARELLWKAAEAGLAEAQCDLGLMLYRGAGGPKDEALAEMWLNKAAAQGLERAAANLQRINRKLGP